MSKHLINRIEQASEAHRSLEQGAITRIRGLQRALFMCAAHCQGGHSEAGAAAAAALDIPFPVRMPALEAKAIAEGFDPAELWPWLMKQRAQRGISLVRA